MATQWVLVADAAHARIFSRAQGDGTLSLVENMTHAESQAHEGDLRTGGKGSVQESTGSGRHQPDPQTSTSEKHADIFAKQVGERLKQAVNDGEFTSLVIAAAPSFLGLLREQLDRPIEDTLSTTIDKNWAQAKPEEIEKLLNDQL